MTQTKFIDLDNNIHIMQYVEASDYFRVWSEELPNFIYTFDPEEVESYLNRGVWKRLT
jgi:hypothetical protein